MARVTVKKCNKCTSNKLSAISNKLDVYYNNVYLQEKNDIKIAIDTLKTAKTIDLRRKYKDYIACSTATR